MRGSELLVRTLLEHNVKYVFGLPGDTSIDWYEALYDFKDQITHILVTDEKHAVYMADAYARITRKPGVCEGPSGGGATYMAPGIFEAHNSSIPLIAMNTDIPTDAHGKAVLTEIDQVRLFDVATKWSISVDFAERIPEFVRKAFRIATTGKPGAVHLAFPMDVLASHAPYAEHPKKNLRFSVTPTMRFLPPRNDLKKALDLLLKSETPFIIVGGGVHISGAYGALERFATAIGCPVGTSITGKGSIDERHPLSVGVVGENGGSTGGNKMVMDADLIIFVGTQTGSVVTSHWQTPPNDGKRKIIQIDVDPEEIGRNYTVDCGLIGDAHAVLQELTRMIEKKIEKRKDGRITEILKIWEEKEREKKANAHTTPLHPVEIVKICENLLPENTILIADAGTPTPYFASYYRLKAGRNFLAPRAYGALGYAVPAAVGVYVADRSSRVVSLTGDGSMLMSMAELSTIVREGIPAIVIVFHNNEYSWVKTHLKYRKDGKYLSVDLPDIRYDKVAESMGLVSYTAETAAEFEDSLRDAVQTSEPSLIDARTLPLHEIESKLPWKTH